MVDDLDEDPHAEEYWRALCEDIDRENRCERGFKSGQVVHVSPTGRFGYSPAPGVHVDGRIRSRLPRLPTLSVEDRLYPPGRYGRNRRRRRR